MSGIRLHGEAYNYEAVQNNVTTSPVHSCAFEHVSMRQWKGFCRGHSIAQRKGSLTGIAGSSMGSETVGADLILQD